MHGWQGDSQRDDYEEHLVENLFDNLGEVKKIALASACPPSQFLDRDRSELQHQDGRIATDAQSDFDHHGIEIEIRWPQNVPEIPPAADVDQHGKTSQAVAEHAGQDRRAHERMIVALVEDIDDQRDGVTAAADCRAGHHIVGQPQSPGVTVIQIRHSAESKDKPYQHQRPHEGNHEARNDRGWRDVGAPERFRAHAYSSPFSWWFAECRTKKSRLPKSTAGAIIPL